MDSIRLWHQGLPLDLTPVTDEAEQRVYGLGLKCPSCSKDFFINTGIGPRPDHHMARNSRRQVTILPEIRCPFHCGWCVRVIDDIATLCQLRRSTDI